MDCPSGMKIASQQSRFYEYTTEWICQVQLGGLLQVSEQAYLFISFSGIPFVSRTNHSFAFGTAKFFVVPDQSIHPGGTSERKEHFAVQILAA